MEQRLPVLARVLWPELETMSELERIGSMYELVGAAYSVPLALVGLVWLIVRTDLSLIGRAWPTLLLLYLLLLLLREFDFFFFLETEPGAFAQFSSSFEGIITWSAALVFGPTALWVAVLGDLVGLVRAWRRAASTRMRWDAVRNAASNLAISTLTRLLSLVLYQRLGGVYPLPGLTLAAVLPAFYATLAQLFLSVLVYVPLLLYVIRMARVAPDPDSNSPWARAIAVGIGAVTGSAFLVQLWAILAAGLHTLNGPPVFFFFIAGLLVASWLAHRLSRAVERSQQRSRELAKLEALGRALLEAPPDASTLPGVLRDQIPGMFSRSEIEIRMGRSPLYSEQTILRHPNEGIDAPAPVGAPVWLWQRAHPEPRCFSPKTDLPWGGQLDASTAVVLAPILDPESSDLLGGIYLSRRWDAGAIAHLLPAVQSLAAQIASALHRAKVYKIEQDMAVAGQIQAGFLPKDTPRVPGWQLAATLEPARETSGDFYDLFPLPEAKLGLLVADVADKGLGAALYMAASRTLIRTYAAEHDTRPELALGAANRRILADTRAGLFVSVFYGVLDPTAGTLTYCNAGHNPPYLFRARADGAAQALTKTGMVLGVSDDVTWEQRTIHLDAGDLLVLYTDGVTDAENGQGRFFGTERLLETITAFRERSAQEIRDALIEQIHQFVGDAPQFDDITLMVVGKSA